MSSVLTDPLEAGKMRYCSACDNNSANYAGRIISVPSNPETRFEWLVRMGVIKRTDPMPKAKAFFICDNHFDKERDFSRTSNGIRLRTRILPWKNLKTGSYSYHGCENLLQQMPAAPPCQCACCKRRKSPSFATTVTIQTDDVEGSGDESGRISIPEEHCRLCLRGARALMRVTSYKLRRLFREDTQQPADPELMEQIYVTTGLMLHGNREPGALICAECTQQAEQAYRFRLQSRSNHRTYLASIPAKRRKELYPELVYPKGSKIRDGAWEEELSEPRDIEQVQLVPTEQVHFKIEPDLPPQSVAGDVSTRLKRNAMDMASNTLPTGPKNIKLEPGLMDGEQIASGINFVAENGMPIQIVDFQVFKTMLTKIKAEKGS